MLQAKHESDKRLFTLLTFTEIFTLISAGMTGLKDSNGCDTVTASADSCISIYCLTLFAIRILPESLHTAVIDSSDQETEIR